MLSFTTKGLPQSGDTLGIFSTAAARSSALPFGTTWMKTAFEAFASIRRYTSSIASDTCPMTELYRGMDRAALDAAYNNGAAVRNSAEIVTDWQGRGRPPRPPPGPPPRPPHRPPPRHPPPPPLPPPA